MARRRNRARSRNLSSLVSRWNIGPPRTAGSVHVEHQLDRPGEGGPRGPLRGELLPPRAGQVVALGAPIVVGGAPFGRHPAAAPEPPDGRGKGGPPGRALG